MFGGHFETHATGGISARRYGKWREQHAISGHVGPGYRLPPHLIHAALRVVGSQSVPPGLVRGGDHEPYKQWRGESENRRTQQQAEHERADCNRHDDYGLERAWRFRMNMPRQDGRRRVIASLRKAHSPTRCSGFVESRPLRAGHSAKGRASGSVFRPASVAYPGRPRARLNCSGVARLHSC